MVGDWNSVTVSTKPSKLAEITLRDQDGLPLRCQFKLNLKKIYFDQSSSLE